MLSKQLEFIAEGLQGVGATYGEVTNMFPGPDVVGVEG